MRVKQTEHHARAVPGHVGMVPFHPSQRATIGAEGRLHVKIRAMRQDAGPGLAI